MNQHDDEQSWGRSRRRFLRDAAALAAAGAASAVVGPGLLTPTAQELPGTTPAPGDCDCSADSALPIFSAAAIGGAYVALSTTTDGPRLFSLTLDAARGVSLGAMLSYGLPPEFEATTLGVVRGQLVMGGGTAVPWRSYVADDRVEPIQVFGVQPAAFLVQPAFAEAIAMPDFSREVFAAIGGVAETGSGTLVLLIEHSGGEPESRYANAIDVFEEVPGGWALRASARNLGESGPNHLVVNGASIGAEMTTSQGNAFIGTGEPVARALTTLSSSSQLLAGDAVVNVVPVAGAKGQFIVIGAQSARLVEEV
jgi:hypothetical protein